MSSAKYANNHNKLVSTHAGLTIGVFDTFQCTKTPTGDSANRSRNKQDLCKIVHPGLDLVSIFGAHTSEWNIVKHNHHSLMSKLCDPLC